MRHVRYPGAVMTYIVTDANTGETLATGFATISDALNRCEKIDPDESRGVFAHRADWFQVVAVYPSGTRYAIRDPHETLERADLHLGWCRRDADPEDTWIYCVDRYHVGTDGQIHWTGGVLV